MTEFKRSLSAQRERALQIYERLHAAYPDVFCTLDYENPFQLIVMTALAAQCTDARVNIVAPELFRRWPDAHALAEAPQRDIEQVIHSCGFYRAKAKNIKALAARLVAEHGGEVPADMDALVQLAGVGRKTANVILGECFGHQGVIVDTHCTRLANRMGFTKKQDAVQIERELMKVWPPAHWTEMSHFTVWHGRAVCPARAPRCSECVIADLCPFPTTREGKKIAK